MAQSAAIQSNNAAVIAAAIISTYYARGITKLDGATIAAISNAAVAVSKAIDEAAGA